MNTQKFEAFIGFIVISLAFIFLGYGIHKSDLISSGSSYELRADFSNISGLSAGSDVRVSGVKVGSISKTSLNPETMQARIHLNIQNDVKIPADSSVKIASDSLLGGSHIAIEVGSDEAYLKPNDSFEYTQSSVSLMDLLARAVFSSGSQ